MPDPEETPKRRILHDIGFLGHFLHMHRGGRNGKQHILVKLWRNGSTMTQRDLLESSCVTSASLSEVVSKLEAEGLVSRERSATDRRQLTITLTPVGKARAEELERTRKKFDGLALDYLNDDEAADLADKLDRMANHWRQIESSEREREEHTTC